MYIQKIIHEPVNIILKNHCMSMSNISKILRVDAHLSKSVFPNLFLASTPFSDKQISITTLPCLAHISTQFFVLYI